MQRALIIGGIGVVLLAAAFVLRLTNQVEQPELQTLVQIQPQAARPKAETAQPAAPQASPEPAKQIESASKAPAASEPTFDVVRVNPQAMP